MPNVPDRACRRARPAMKSCASSAPNESTATCGCSCSDHLVEARVPVVEIGSREPGRETALDGEHVDAARRDARRERRPAPARASRRRPTRAAAAPREDRLRGCGRLVRATRRRLRERSRRRRQRQVHLRVDVVLVLAADRDLQLVPRRRQVQRAADRDERPRHARARTSRRTPCGWICACLRSPSASSSAASTSANRRIRKPRSADVASERHQKRK